MKNHPVVPASVSDEKRGHGVERDAPKKKNVQRTGFPPPARLVRPLEKLPPLLLPAGRFPGPWRQTPPPG